IWKHPWLVPLISFSLIGFFLFGMARIFGPAIAAEARYQIKSAARELGAEDGDWRRIVLPTFSFRAPPPGEVGDFGIEIPAIFVQEQVIANVDPTNKEVYTKALREGIAHA